MRIPNLVFAIAVWSRHRDAFVNKWGAEIGGIILEPIMMLGAIGFGLGQFVAEFEEGVSYAEYVAPGILAGYTMFHALFEGTYGAYMRMSMQKVFGGILATPVEVQDLVVGEILWGATRSFMTSIAILSVASILGLVMSPWALLVVPSGFLSGLAFASIALCITGVAPTLGSLQNVFTLFATPMFFLSGIFFPISSLPGGVQIVVWALPLTQAVHLIRGLTMGDVTITHLFAAMGLLLHILIFGMLACVLMRRRIVV